MRFTKKKCDMCHQKHDGLFAFGGFDLCAGCKRTMQQCDNQPGTRGPVKEVQGFGPAWKVRKEF